MRYLRRVRELLAEPFPVGSTVRALIKKFKLFSYETRVLNGCIERPHYAYCMYHAAKLAERLNVEKISIIEFGVAKGDGLMAMERHAVDLRRCSTTKVELYGFDTGAGLPQPKDYRDVSYLWKPGQYAMDHDNLVQSLTTARLIIGDVKHTLDGLFVEQEPAPIGAVFFDLDYYSSTVEALGVFSRSSRYYLPRIFCYFDDTLGNASSLLNDFTGERLAINEFNTAHPAKKLASPYFLLREKFVQTWHHKIWIYHDFEHPRYNDYIAS